MNDADELLRADARRWNREQPAAPDLDAAADVVMASSARGQYRLGRGPITGKIGAVIAVAATVIAAVLITSRRNGDTSDQPAPQIGAPKSIVIAGKNIPYAGGIPWTGAIVATRQSSSITIAADGDSIVTKKFICGLPQERVYARESSATVTILVAGYAGSLPAHESCGGVGHQPQVHRIILSQPLGSRRLIDATGMRGHEVLVAATVPAPKVPRGFTADPVRWDERTGVVMRNYRKATDAIELEYGTADTVAASPGASRTRLESVRIAAATATVWRYQDVYNDLTTIIWSIDQHRLALTVQGDPKHHLSIATAISVARTVE